MCPLSQRRVMVRAFAALERLLRRRSRPSEGVSLLARWEGSGLSCMREVYLSTHVNCERVHNEGSLLCIVLFLFLPHAISCILFGI